jgi:hypothetical protein
VAEGIASLEAGDVLPQQLRGLPTTEAKKLTHTAHCTGGEGKKTHWQVIGAGWELKDGNGVVLQLDCFPRDGRVIIKPAEKGLVIVNLIAMTNHDLAANEYRARALWMEEEAAERG